MNSLFSRLGLSIPQVSYDNSVWLHGASVGEVRSLKPLVDDIRRLYPHYKIVMTTITSTGLAMAQDYVKADTAFLLPIENRFAISKLLTRFNCKLFFIMETELWPILISTVHAKKVPLILINARMSAKSEKTYRRFSFIFRWVLNKFDMIYAKSAEDAARFLYFVPPYKVESLGNMKNFAISPDINSVMRVVALEGKRILLAASTHSPEEALLLDELAGRDGVLDGCALVIVPRHIVRAPEIREYALSKGFTVGLYSKGEFEAQILIVDEFGLLNIFYDMAERVFVGGSLALNVGGHNIQEAFIFRKSVVVGKYMQNFSEILQLAQEFCLATTADSMADVVDYFLGGSSDYCKPDFDGYFAKLEVDKKHFQMAIESCLEKYL